VSETFQFLAFSILVILAYHASRSSGWRRAVVLLANIGFLATFYQGARASVPFLAFFILTFAGLRLIQWRRGAFLPVLILTIAGFIWIKKYTFLPSSLFLPFTYVTVGLSYILFRVLHLMIETWSGKFLNPVGLASFFNYTTNFTTLVSGPIQLYPAYQATENPADRPPLSSSDVALAIERITRGIFKTNILSLLLSTFQSRMIERVLSDHNAGAQLVAGALMFVLFPLFIYCNFSGYIDIVIGVGRLLGVTLPENFARPFAADNVIDFWSNRWHITLSSWLKIYVYNPMLIALMRRFPSPAMASASAVFAFFVTFFLVGVWHGQTSEFVFCGFLLGLGVSVNKLYQILMVAKFGRSRYAALGRNPLYIAVARGLTFTWMAFTLIWFWSNWGQLRTLQAALGTGMLLAIWGTIWIGATLLLAAWEAAYSRLIAAAWNDVPLVAQSVRVAWSTALVVVIMAVNLVLNQPAPAIVYKAF